METRREFVKKAAMLAGAAGLWNALPASIERAYAIDPAPGSTYLDAEHIVILMQENRSFDHCFGSLQGVRGFNDPRAITLPSGDPVWLQRNAKGETYAPFRLNLKETNATWMGSLPHSWTNQVDARNHGAYDKWLDAKSSGHKEYRGMPLTLGYYDRNDIPFYYALADAFTICDQNFCSSLTGTTPNRLYLWTGTIREKPTGESPALVQNEDVDYGAEARWTTFPERLEDLGIPWKIYQNEISLDSGFQGEEDSWLSNFTDNPIEWFSQYNVRHSQTHRAHRDKRIAELRALPTLTDEQKATLKRLEAEQARWNQESFDTLTPREKSLHQKAFCTNVGDPDYRQLTTLTYKDGDAQRTVQVPKGDVLHQFRQDVANGTLPTVSWLVAPENFSDHPTAPWYGAWYVSEALDILTQKPDVWKKTIFIVTYDENDGYFDHVPPFVAPHPDKPETGKVSPGIDTSVEFVTMEQDRKRRPEGQARESPIGLGYRVPLLIASPWSRGGTVCSEVFDHTSVLQFLETFLTYKTGKKVEESNISAWRRTVCGDLTSVFQPYQGQTLPLPAFLPRDPYIESIHQARFKKLPSGYHGLTDADIAQIKQDGHKSPHLPRQEEGTRPSCPLPYELSADGNVSDGTFTLHLAADNKRFGKRASGAPFTVYAFDGQGSVAVRNYAVAAGSSLDDTWILGDNTIAGQRFEVYGPNGFFREFRRAPEAMGLEVRAAQADRRVGARPPQSSLVLTITNHDSKPRFVEVHDAYRKSKAVHTLSPGKTTTVTLPTASSFGWYDVSVQVFGTKTYQARYAGRIETGAWSQSDPLMAKVG